MGQEIVYCFKCQKRILGTEVAKGLAYQVENQMCCSTCVVLIMDTLTPKAKEQLLAKMYQAGQAKQSASSGGLKAMPGPLSSSSTRKIPTQPGPLPGAPARDDSSSTPMVVGISVAVVAVVLIAVAFSGGSSPAPAPTPSPVVKRPPPPPPPPPPDPGLSSEEKRRAETAREAMRKARDFAQANPKDVEGQLRLWRSALLDAARTGYEAEAKRELDRTELRAKEAAGAELGELDRQVRGPLHRRDFKAAQGILDEARGRRSTAEWASLVDRLQLELQETIARVFIEVKEKAIAARDRGAKAEVDAAKADVARWGLPQYVAELDQALAQAWRALFDGKTAKSFVGFGSLDHWTVVDGALTHIPGTELQAGQSKEDIGDGEFRVRFSVDRSTACFFAVRQGGDGSCRAAFNKPALDALGPGEHVLVFTCRGLEVSATLDEKPLKLEIQGKVNPRGRMQFNSTEGVIRIHAVETRPLP